MGRRYDLEIRLRGEIAPGSRESRRALRVAAEAWQVMALDERREFMAWIGTNHHVTPPLPDRRNARSILAIPAPTPLEAPAPELAG